MSIEITINAAEFEVFKGLTAKMITNLLTGVPDAITGIMNNTKELASSKTHQGATRKLFQAWKVDRSSNAWTLYNTMPYAITEFGRGGEKVRGNPPLGPHNIIPELMDLMSSNIEPTLTKAIMNNLTR